MGARIDGARQRIEIEAWRAQQAGTASFPTGSGGHLLVAGAISGGT
jgi:hypothetical protein